jgi:hypothetical protein
MGGVQDQNSQTAQTMFSILYTYEIKTQRYLLFKKLIRPVGERINMQTIPRLIQLRLFS